MLWSLVLVPVLAAAGVFAAGMRARPALAAAACGAMLLLIVLAALAASAGWTGAIVWSEALVLSARLTPLSAMMAVLVPTVALPVLAYASAHEEKQGLNRLIVLLLVFVGGMELVVVAADLLTLFIGWELVGACSWALIGHQWRTSENPRSGLYAFVMTRSGDLGLLAAAMAAFAGTGSFAYDSLDGLSGPLLHVTALGLLVSAASKSAQLPFSPWLFRAMAGPTSVSALLHAATMVAAGAYLVARLQPVLAAVFWFPLAAITLGLATALSAGLVAVLQPHAKKLLAASTSAHFGLMFIAVGAGYPGVALLHLAAHAAFKALMFLAAGIAGTRAGSFALERMAVGRALLLTAALSAVGALALAGIPPLGGGWTKEAIVAAAEHKSIWIAVGVMLAGGLSAAYAVRFQFLAFRLREDVPDGDGPGRMELVGVLLLAVLTLALSVLWLPPVRAGVAQLLAVSIPDSKAAAFVASLVVLAAGLLVGLLLARRYPGLGSEGRTAGAADWLGLPTLIRAAVARPFQRLSGAAAGFENGASAAARRALRPERGRRGAAWFDDAVADAGPRAVAAASAVLTAAAAHADRRVVDGGIELVGSLAARYARLSDAIGERIADGLPEGPARIVGMCGTDARRLQTGMAHHYYGLVAGGTALLILALVTVS